MKLETVVGGLAVIFLATTFCTRRPAAPPTAKLSDQEASAVAAAEMFIRENGYTDQAADPAKVQWGIMDDVSRDVGVPAAEVLRWRRKSVVAQAYGLSRHRGRGRPGWTVYFEHDPEFLSRLREAPPKPSEATGRAVEVSPDLTELEMPHLDIFLKTAELVLRPPAVAPGARQR